MHTFKIRMVNSVLEFDIYHLEWEEQHVEDKAKPFIIYFDCDVNLADIPYFLYTPNGKFRIECIDIEHNKDQKYKANVIKID